MKATEGTEGEKEPGDFAAFLASTRPKTNLEMAEELKKLVGAVRDTGKAGSLTLTIKVAPVDGSTDVVAVHDVVKANRPEHTRLPSLAYPDRENNLKRTDPNSMPLFETDEDIKDAPAADPRTGEIKEAPSA